MSEQETTTPVVVDNVLPSSSIFTATGGSTTLSGKGGGAGGFNTRIVIEESKEWTSPITGYVKMTLIGGGAGGSPTVLSGTVASNLNTYCGGTGGNSGVFKELYLYVKHGTKYPIIIGEGGKGGAHGTNNVSGGNIPGGDGGDTSITIDDKTYTALGGKWGTSASKDGESVPEGELAWNGIPKECNVSNGSYGGMGGGPGGGFQRLSTDDGHGTYYGAGGAGGIADGTGNVYDGGDGHDGAIIIEYSDPNKTTIAEDPLVVDTSEVCNYTNTEQVIGIWYGKPLYRRTFELTTPSSDVEQSVIADLEASHIEKVVSIRGIVVSTANSSAPINHYGSGDNRINVWISQARYLAMTLVNATAELFDCPLRIILEYTKTTDIERLYSNTDVTYPEGIPEGSTIPVAEAKGNTELLELERLRKLSIGCPKYWRSTTLPPDHAWPDGSIVYFADRPELREIYLSGGLDGMVLPYDATEEEIDNNRGKFRANSEEATGLYMPRDGKAFFKLWHSTTGTDAGILNPDGWTNSGAEGSINQPIIIYLGLGIIVNVPEENGITRYIGVSNDFTYYSEEETRVGTWLDGKPIYRKTIVGYTPSNANIYNDLSDEIPNIENVISLQWNLTRDTSIVVPNWTGANINYEYVSVIFNKTTNKLQSYTTDTINLNKPIIAIFEYTKTTDEPDWERPTTDLGNISTGTGDVNVTAGISSLKLDYANKEEFTDLTTLEFVVPKGGIIYCDSPANEDPFWLDLEITDPYGRHLANFYVRNVETNWYIVEKGQKIKYIGHEGDYEWLGFIPFKETPASNGTTYQGDVVVTPNVFSYDEQVIGKWVNDKPIYRKVIKGFTPSELNTQVNISDDIIECDECISLSWTVERQLNVITASWGTSNVDESIQVLYDKQFKKICSKVKEDINLNRAITIILEYTKTTDTDDTGVAELPVGQDLNILHNVNFSWLDYTLEEKIVGTWVDGKLLYRKVVPVLVKDLSVDDPSFTLSVKDLDIEKLIDISGYISSEDNAINLPIIYCNSAADKCVVYLKKEDDDVLQYITSAAFNSSTMHAILTYTKVHDRQVSKTPVITVTTEKAQDGGQATTKVVIGKPKINETHFIYHAEDYNTDEQYIGRWVNKKPLYRKSFVLTTPSTTATSELLDISDLGYETIIHLAYIIPETGLTEDIIGWVGEDAVNIYVSTDKKLMAYVTSEANTEKEVVVTLEYTKLDDDPLSIIPEFEKYDLCEFYYFRHPRLKRGFKIANGDLIEDADVEIPRVFEYLQTDDGAELCVSEAEWQELHTKAYYTDANGKEHGFNGVGGVPWFVIDVENKTVRLPDIRETFPVGVGTPEEVGQADIDRSREMIGQFLADTNYTDETIEGYTKGVFHASTSDSKRFLFQNDNATAGGINHEVIQIDNGRTIPVAEYTAPKRFGVLATVYVGI